MYRISTLRRVTAALVLAGLSACSGGSAVVPQTQTVPSTAAIAAGINSTYQSAAIAGDTCRFAPPTSWQFGGPCKNVSLNANGGSVTLPRFKGMTLTTSFPGEMSGTIEFASGEGTTDRDITGMFESIKFPVYGSVGCQNPFGGTLPCPGRAILYNAIRNESATEEVLFTHFPTFTISKKHLPGTRCELVGLHPVQTGQFTWTRYPIYGVVKGSTVTLSSKAVLILEFPPKKFAVFGFVCN